VLDLIYFDFVFSSKCTVGTIGQRKMLLVCGYKRTGKDALFNVLIEQKESYGMSLYRNPLVKSFCKDEYKNATRVAFADKLKQEVLQEYGVKITDENKDIDIGGYTGRQLCIMHSAKKRSNNDDYYCNIDLLSDNVIVTDWRSENEYNYWANRKELKTLRIVRSTAEIPTEETEHYLDKLNTDYILTDSFEYSVKLFPQYCDYVFDCII